jgi:LPXTG-site transpeptidase (sortase) family protein
MPIRLKIPKINVDADIEYVGLTAGGSMDVPKGPADVAWFDLGPRPGENGSAVIAGHYGWKDGIPAAFDDLYLLGKGDKIYVEGTTSVNGIGTTTVFVVREIRLYGNKDDAASVFYSSDGKAHLNLITCQGVWDKSQKSYSNRLVVFADQE